MIPLINFLATFLCLLTTIPLSQACSPSPGLSEVTYKDFYNESALVWKLDALYSREGKDAEYPDSLFSEKQVYFCRVRKVFKGCRLRKTARYVWLATSSSGGLCGGFLSPGTILIMLSSSSTTTVLLDPLSSPVPNVQRPNPSAFLSTHRSFRFSTHRHISRIGRPGKQQFSKHAVAANLISAQTLRKGLKTPQVAKDFSQSETGRLPGTSSQTSPFYSFLSWSPYRSSRPSPSASPSSILDYVPVEAYFFSQFTYQQSFPFVSKETKRFLRKNRNLTC